MKMRIGILTFHKANNFGAVLQAVALQTFINKNINKSEIIDYYPNNAIPKKRSIFYTILRFGKRALIPKKSWDRYIKEKKFDDFRTKYYSLSDDSYYGDADIKKRIKDYDIYISGSDQILNTTLTGESEAFYLNFDDNAKKISYASSFGREQISSHEKALIKSELPKFSCISVREKTAGEIIEDEIRVKTQLVLDPVFLLDLDEWDKFCSNTNKAPFRYIFVYSMEISIALEKLVDNLCREYELPAIVVRGGGKPGRINGKEDAKCGPSDFLRYIRDAEIVVTNSFHGTAFSVIFQKKFFCVAHSTRNTRLENIMELTSNANKIIYEELSNSDISSYLVDGETSYKEIKTMISESKEYLHRSLKF